jgi:acetyl esterase/lipase
MLRLRLFAALSIAVAVTGLVSAADDPQTTKPKGRVPSEEQLQDLLKRYPGADANKDGKLTAEEARNYRATVEAQRNRKQRPADADRPKPTKADVSYGPHERNVFDFYQAASDRPTPLVIYIHGGGFVAGDKTSIKPEMVKLANEAGISVAALNYRFVNGADVIFPAPQRDCARAVQFLRSRASEYNLDPNKIACYGGSAGAGTSMWIAFHDDLADSHSDDPVARQSTRIVAVGTMGGQGTYDPIKIKKLIGGRAWEHPSIFKVYGVMTADEALHPTPEKQKLYDEASAITHLTKDDPPLYMIYTEADGPLPADARPGQGIHHPNFGRQLQKAMNELGIENVMVNGQDEVRRRDTTKEMLEFFRKAFAKVVE